MVESSLQAVHPSLLQLHERYSADRYGSRARCVKRGPGLHNPLYTATTLPVGM